MTAYRLNQKEIDALLVQPRHVRYGYLLKRVADWGALWVLSTDEGDAMFGDADGRKYLGVWPFRPFAERCAVGDWQCFRAREIPLKRFLDAEISALASDGIGIAIFPTPNDVGGTIDPESFGSDLMKERSRL